MWEGRPVIVLCQHVVRWIRRVNIIPNQIFRRVVGADVGGIVDMLRNKADHGGNEWLLLNEKI